MKIKKLPATLVALLAGFAASSASAQVIFEFNGAAISPVPLSPWITALLGIMLGAVGLTFLRRKTSQGVFLLLLSFMAGGGAMMQARDGYAYSVPALVSLLTSGTEVTGSTVAWMTPGPVCGPIGYVRVNSGAGKITLTGISYAENYAALDPLNPPASTDGPLPTPSQPLCSVGTALDSSNSCIVWYHKPGGC